MSKTVTLKKDGSAILCNAIDFAIARGMARYDKYSENPLNDASKSLLYNEIASSFWLYFDDEGIEVR